MFVKIDDGIIVNLLHVSEVRDNGSEMKIYMDDGEEHMKVKDRQNFLNRMNVYNQVFQRLANGNF